METMMFEQPMHTRNATRVFLEHGSVQPKDMLAITAAQHALVALMRACIPALSNALQLAPNATTPVSVMVKAGTASPGCIHDDSGDDEKDKHFGNTAFTVFVFPANVTVNNGAAAVYLGSTTANTRLDAKNMGRSLAHVPTQRLEGERGDVWVMDVRLLHRGMPNLSDTNRVVHTFMFGDVQPGAGHLFQPAEA